MKAGFAGELVVLVLVCAMCGCVGLPSSKVAKIRRTPVPEENRAPDQLKPSVTDTGWTERVVTEEELLKLAEKDPGLDLMACREILARLNTKATVYISEDIRKEKPLRVPNDFAAYKEWTPLPRQIAEIANVAKFILVVKDIPFLGWYEKGELKQDTYICIGKKWDMTETGMYRVEDKHAERYSRSYPNAFGQPAWMPWSLRIYGGVFIHAGDITKGYCSPGCIVLPFTTAEKLFYWAPVGTTVLVLDSLEDLQTSLKGHQKRLAWGR